MSERSLILRFEILLLWRSLKKLLNLIRPISNNVFNINNPLGLKLLTRLRIGSSQLKERKLKYTFLDSVDPLCSCGNNIESTVHFFLHCANFATQRETRLKKLKSVNASVLVKNENSVVRGAYLEEQSFFIQLTKKFLMQPLASF